MSVVVCNAGPLIALAGIGKAELLRDLFSTVLVSEEVKIEIEAGRQKTGAGLFLTSPWLQVQQLQHPPDPLLISALDLGEAATISLARQETADLVLLDEIKGRHLARNVYGLAVIGTARLLAEAKRAFLISQVRPLLDEMRGNGYWISDKIVSEILRQAGELSSS